MRYFSLGGVLFKENEADADLLFELYPPQAVIAFWEEFKPIIMWSRERRNNPHHHESFEYLYDQAKKRYPDILPRTEFNINNT